MSLRSSGCAIFAGLVLLLCAGCGGDPGKSGAIEARAQARSEGTVLARLHWAGASQVSKTQKSTLLKSLTQLPESAALKAEVLNKLAAAPWKMQSGWQAVAPGAQTNLLRGLLEDAWQHETRLEIRSGTGGRGEAVLAVRLPEKQAAVWQTNLAVAMQQVTGVKVSPSAPNGWSLKKHDFPNLLEFRRAGAWTLVGLAQDENKLLTETLARVAVGKTAAGFARTHTNSWLEIEADVAGVSHAMNLGLKPPAGFPRVLLTYTGDGDKLRTEGRLKFSEPLKLDLKPWNVPISMINDPLVSFAAMRGIGPWLSGTEMWKDLEAGPAPNQLFAWGQGNIPLLTFWAAPTPSPKLAPQLTNSVLNKLNPILEDKKLGKMEPLAQTNGIAWTGFPFVAPFLRPLKVKEGDFIQMGLIARAVSNAPPPAELIQQVTSRKDLVYYDWEVTPPRIEAWIYLAQLFRLFGMETQVPPEGTAMKWLKAAGPKLGNCATIVTQTAPDELSILRNSTVGLSSLEMQLVADWLESPTFPRGVYSKVTAHSLSKKVIPAPGQPPKK